MKLAPKESCSGLNFDLGAPGQSTLKSGPAISVTRRLFFFRMLFASAISLASRFTTFLSHMLRSSIHSIPNCCDATSQARPKSCEISSLITAILNGDLGSRTGEEVVEDDVGATGTGLPRVRPWRRAHPIRQ